MTLILLPNLLDDEADLIKNLPMDYLKQIIPSLDGLIAEDEKKARRYLLKFVARDDLPPIKLLNEHSSEDDLQLLLNLISKEKWGLISDAGLPCIADPGSKLVFLAREKNIKIEAVFGPSSIFLALMLSGLGGQKFCFQGYLPRKEDELIKKIKFLEKISSLENATQIFIEAPYRSDKMFNILKKTLKPKTYLSIAISLTSKDQRVITKKVKDFENLVIGKNPSVFLFKSF